MTPVRQEVEFDGIDKKLIKLGEELDRLEAYMEGREPHTVVTAATVKLIEHMQTLQEVVWELRKEVSQMRREMR